MKLTIEELRKVYARQQNFAPCSAGKTPESWSSTTTKPTLKRLRGNSTPRPLLSRIQPYSGLVAFRSDSCTDCINAFQRSLKLGPVETDSCRT